MLAALEAGGEFLHPLVLLLASEHAALLSAAVGALHDVIGPGDRAALRGRARLYGAVPCLLALLSAPSHAVQPPPPPRSPPRSYHKAGKCLLRPRTGCLDDQHAQRDRRRAHHNPREARSARVPVALLVSD